MLEDYERSHANHIQELNTELDSQKELVVAYQQLIAAQNKAVGATAQVGIPPPTLKRTLASLSPQLSKRLKIDAAAQYTNRSNNTSTYEENPDTEQAYDYAHRAPRSSCDQPLLRGSDHYDPPYRTKTREIDRYVPTSPSRVNHLTPPSPPRGPATSLSANGLPPKPVQASIQNVIPVTGPAALAFVQAQNLGIPYNSSITLGIPRQCTVCFIIFPSGTKLYTHMKTIHGWHNKSKSGLGPRPTSIAPKSDRLAPHHFSDDPNAP